MVLLFLGASGSGKDTQAEIIALKSSFQPISTGNLLRDLSNGASVVQTYIRKSLNDKFSSDELVYGVLQIYLKYCRGEDFILTGAVRRATQITKLDDILEKIGQKVDFVFNFQISSELAIERLSGRLFCRVCKSNYNLKTKNSKIEDKCDKCGSILSTREDDNPESIKIRLSEFYKYNTEIVEEYSKRGILANIDASRSIEDVAKEIDMHLHKLIHKEDNII